MKLEYPKFDNPKITWGSFPNPCYDPQERWGGCPSDLLALLWDARIPAEDRVWAFASCTAVQDSAKRLFAVRCVRETPVGGVKVVADLLADPRSHAALDVAERFALGLASKDELNAARDAARAAASAAARDSVRGAAWGASLAAARGASLAAARVASLAAARVASLAAAREFQVEIAKSMFA